jgi:hypothetical protein
VAGEIVHDYNVARPQRRREELVNVGLENLGVDWSVEDERGDNSFELQSGHESCRFPMAARNRGAQSFAFGSAAVSSRHIGRSPLVGHLMERAEFWPEVVMIVRMREQNGLCICNGHESAGNVIRSFVHRAHRLAKASKSLES